VLQEQAVSIAHLVFLGVTLGLLIDIYRVVIVLISPGKYLAAAYDLLFWFAASLWVFLYMLGVTAGEARFYMIALLAVGYFLEQWILGKALRVSLRSTILVVARLVTRTIGRIAVVLDALFSVLVAPYRFIYRLILRPLRFVWFCLNWPLVAFNAKVDGLRAIVLKWWRGDDARDV